MPRRPHKNIPKPPHIFDRDWEWSELTAFASDEEPGPRLAVVSGRRRRHLDRLRHILGLLAARGVDTTHTRPACYSGIGFTPELEAAAGRGEVVLVDWKRLYSGA